MEDGGQGSGRSWLPSMHQLLPLLLLWVLVVLLYILFMMSWGLVCHSCALAVHGLQHEPSIQGSGVQHDTNKTAAELWTLLYDKLQV